MKVLQDILYVGLNKVKSDAGPKQFYIQNILQSKFILGKSQEVLNYLPKSQGRCLCLQTFWWRGDSAIRNKVPIKVLEKKNKKILNRELGGVKLTKRSKDDALSRGFFCMLKMENRIPFRSITYIFSTVKSLLWSKIYMFLPLITLSLQSEHLWRQQCYHYAHQINVKKKQLLLLMMHEKSRCNILI